jgi:carbohydrate binding protein with CBM4/9 domain
VQRTLKHAAWVLVANASLSVMACATAIEPDVPDLPDPLGGGGGTTGGSGGVVTSAGAGPNANGGKAAAGEGGTASGGAGRGGGTGGTAATGGKNGNGGGGAAATGGKNGNGGGGAAATGGKGGNGGGGTAATGGKGGNGTGGGGTAGGGTAGSGTAGSGTAGGGGGGVNLITNSGFETNTTGWSVFGGSATITSTTAQAHSGTQSLVITGRTQPYQGPQYSVLSLATPGASYSLSLWGKLPSSNSTGSLTVTLHYTCNGGTSAGENYFTWVATAAASASSWTQFSGVQTFPACAGGGSMSAASLYVESPSATLSYYVDDVVFTTP